MLAGSRDMWPPHMCTVHDPQKKEESWEILRFFLNKTFLRETHCEQWHTTVVLNSVLAWQLTHFTAPVLCPPCLLCSYAAFTLI